MLFTNVSILVLIEFIFNTHLVKLKIGASTSLNPCFDRIYFQYLIKKKDQ